MYPFSPTMMTWCACWTIPRRPNQRRLIDRLTRPLDANVNGYLNMIPSKWHKEPTKHFPDNVWESGLWELQWPTLSNITRSSSKSPGTSAADTIGIFLRITCRWTIFLATPPRLMWNARCDTQMPLSWLKDAGWFLSKFCSDDPWLTYQCSR